MSKITHPSLCHIFPVEIAIKLGFPAAVTYQHIFYWVSENKKFNRNIRDGKAWMFQTQEEMLESLPYLSLKQLRYAIEKLEEAELIIRGDYNNDCRKRTCWYALVDESSITAAMRKSKNVCDSDKREQCNVTKGHSLYEDTNNKDTKEKQANEKKVQQAPSKDACLLFSEDEEKLVKHILIECTKLRLGITEKSIRSWSKLFTPQKVAEKIKLFLKRKEKGLKVKSIGGWITCALEEDFKDTLSVIEINRKYAENFKKKCKWLVIEKTGCYPEGSAKDFSYSIPHEKFVKQLQEYYEIVMNGV